MGKLKLTSTQKRVTAIAMIAIAALMLADAVYQIGMHVAWRRWLPATLARQNPTTQPAATQPVDEANKKKPSKPPQVHAAIGKRNLFTKPKPTGHGMKLTGVIGRIALFNRGGQTVGLEEGKSGHGIRIVSIKDYEVTIEYQGKTETMTLFSGPDTSRDASSSPDGETPLNPSPGSKKDTSVTVPPADRAGPAGIDAEKLPAIKRAIRERIPPEGLKGRVIIESDGEAEAVIRIENE